LSTQTAASITSVTHPEEAAFLDAVSGPELRSGNLALACDWYTSFLRSKIREAWIPLFQPVLVGSCKNCQPCEPCMEIAFNFLKTVVSTFPRRNLALVDIVDSSFNSEILREAEGDIDHDESTANQLAFAAIGWISKFRFFANEKTKVVNKPQFLRPSIHTRSATKENLPSDTRPI
jgi:hypothetical protein